jgi:hypothetical protein
MHPNAEVDQLKEAGGMGVEVVIGETGQIDVPQLDLSASQFRLPLGVPAAD